MTDFDEIELAAALAEAETGARAGGSRIPLSMVAPQKENHRFWTSEEDAYLRANHGRICERDMAAHLGRSQIAVHIHIFRELHLVAASKSSDILTAEHVAMGLGMDSKSVHRLMDRGLMPGRRLPGRQGTRVMRAVDRRAFLLWILEPEHWVYFKPERVGAMKTRGKRGFTSVYDYAFWDAARDLVLDAVAKWDDAWLTPGQVANLLGYKNRRTGAHSINTAIHAGNLSAFRWGNWWIRRSAMPAPGMTINVFGRIVPKVKEKYACPRGMSHPNRSTCMKLRFCRELIVRKLRATYRNEEKR